MTRIAIVTGASSGLGREFIKLIDVGEAGEIDEVWAVARREDRLKALERTTRTPVRPFALDLCDPASYDEIETALAERGNCKVALLINNAGAGTFGDFRTQGKGAAGRMMRILMQAPVELTYRALPYMAAGSRIINTASVAAFIPQPQLAVYSTCKRFILDFSRALNVELKGTGITVTALCPKFMHTEFLAQPGDGAAASRMCRIGFEPADRVAQKAIKAANAGRGICIPAPDMKALYVAAKLLPYQAVIAAERMIGVL